MALPDTGTLSYGNVVFDCMYSSKVSCKMEMDRANRGIKYTALKLEVTAHVTNTQAGIPIDRIFPAIRTTLSTPGNVLTWSGKGFGDFVINGVSAVQGNAGFVDVDWGPKPELINFIPLGSGLCARVTWNVTTKFKECNLKSGLANNLSKLLAFTWNSNLSFDDSGYATWSVNGELEIAQTYASRQSIDQWRSMTEPFMPVGFRPIRRSRKMSDDKRTLAFDYAYAEMPPMGIPIMSTKAEGTYSVKAMEQGKLYNPMNRFIHNLQATFVIRPDAPRREAYLRFLGLFQGRLGSSGYGISPLDNRPAIQLLTPPLLRAAGRKITGKTWVWENPPVQSLPIPFVSNNPGPGAFPAYEPGQVYIRSWGFEEGLYENSKTITFNASWHVLCRWDSILPASGAWRKVTDCDPAVWKSWMYDISGSDNWGHYYHNTVNDAVINVCNTIAPPVATPGSWPRPTGPQVNADGTRPSNVLNNFQNQGLFGSWKDPDKGTSPEIGAVVDVLPEANLSWINYQCWFETELDPGTAILKSLPQATYSVDVLSSVDAYSANAQGATGSVNLASKSKQSDNVVRATTSTYKVTLKGYAVRIGYDIPVPGLVSWAGVKPIPGKQHVSGPQIVTQYCGVPVYLTMWTLEYFVPVPPDVPAGQRQFGPPNLGDTVADTNSPPKTAQMPVSAIEPAQAQLGNIIEAPNPAR